MGETKTTTAQVRFAVEQEPVGRPSIRIQQQYVPGIPLLRYGALKLDLEDGVSVQQARDLADVLNLTAHAPIYAGADLARGEPE